MLGSALVEVQFRGHVIQAPTPRMQQVLQLVQKQRHKTRAMAGGGDGVVSGVLCQPQHLLQAGC
jgi:hypothetical protein